ncbi:glycosyltransferase family 4 protein [Candidatus Babeliales bacterium]|nr:glycosyltransferase family 4 protein [Candidatus Babeliales bacterium]
MIKKKTVFDKKKILYIHHGKGIGGAPLSLLYLIENLDKSKYEPVVLFLHDSQVIDLYKSTNITVFGPVNLRDFAHTKIFWYRWYNLKNFIKTCFDTYKILKTQADFWFKKIKPDIVHLNTSSLIAWAKVAHKKNIPVVWHIREPLASGYFGIRRKIVQNFVKNYATKIVPICKNDSLLWQNNNKVNIIYNAVDFKIFDKNILDKNFEQDFLFKYNLDKNSPRILFLGGLSSEKGTLEIFTIFEKILKQLPSANLLVAGYFDLKVNNIFNIKRYFPVDRYKLKIKNLFKPVRMDSTGSPRTGLKEKIVFLGAIKNVPQIMSISDVIVFPATVGHFARPIIEAGFMAKPVVASKISPLDELVINNKTGFLVDIKDINLWVEKLAILLLDKNLNKQMGENAYQYCVQNFNIDMHIKKIESIYEGLYATK